MLVVMIVAVLSACNKNEAKYDQLFDYISNVPIDSCQQEKKMIEETPFNNPFVHKNESIDYYQFYFQSYKISVFVRNFVPFKHKEEINIVTVDIIGKPVAEFCSNVMSQEQQKEVLNVLLSK